MNARKNINKTMITRAVISKIEKESNPNIIKAKNIKNLENPGKITLKGKKEEYTPDIEVIYKNEILVYEIELEREIHINKWRMLSLYAKKHNGSFYIIVPDYLKEEIKKEIINSDINAGLIYFNVG